MSSALKKSGSATKASSGTTIVDPKDGFCVYSMMRKTKKKTPLKRDGISQACMSVKEYRIITEFYISGYGSIPVIKGDPTIMPLKAQDCISQGCMSVKEYRIITEFYISGYGSIPVIKGDPTIMPLKAQLFVAEKAKLMRPQAIYICDGSLLERMDLTKKITQNRVARTLEALSDCYLITTDPRDASTMARHPVVCTKNRERVGIRHRDANSKFAKWISQFTLGLELDERFPAAMNGRVMYVVPFSLGPIGSMNSLNCIQLTDSAYVALMTSVCARVSASVWDSIGNKQFIRCIHSVGIRRPAYCRLTNNWPCAPDRRFLALHANNREVWSYGTGSEDAILCKNEVALRLASITAKQEGWLAERMAIIAVTAPDKVEHFIGVAGPDGCGKSCLTFLQTTTPEWKIKVIGNEVAWIRLGDDGRLYASSPLNGLFFHINGFNPTKSSMGKEFLSKDAIFTNVGYTSQGYPCWSSCDMHSVPGEVTYDWRGEPWNNNSEGTIEHPQASVAIRCNKCPALHSQWESDKGVALSAIIFCTRRHTGIPLVFEALTWKQGVFQAATIRTDSPKSAQEGELTFDPMGMAAFLGYSFGDYLKHWLSFDKPKTKLPKLFFVNLFQRGSNNEYLWPGFRDNIRILAWIIRRITSGPEDGVVKSYVGLVPKEESINLTGLNVKWDELIATPKAFWISETKALRKIFDTILGADIPKGIADEFLEIGKRLSAA
ncbi:Phosphoenolpyruvate carboxykinase [GTP] [Toxocara canis]|uniref:phosphoenolpyruvate carboxykinase (GTP) n=1 Tax=Toxocara canis TaxID=6265 RepID=A0A0B2VEN0_TOXCA|nr:Phosphoenolpyruvate carboxykinase [GTP] [Toxocara canis]